MKNLNFLLPFTMVLVMWSGYSSTSLYGQTSIWLPKVDRTPTHLTYTYNIQAPDYLAQWILTVPQPGNVVPKTINGQAYSFVERNLAWDNDGSCPARTGQIRFDATPNNDPNGNWKEDGKLKGATDVIQALNTAASPSDSRWKFAHILALKWEGGTPPQLTFKEEIPLLDQAKTRMAEFARNTRPGEFYPEVNVPVDLAGYRAAMLEIVNLGRRDPDYRAKNRNAPDLRAEYAPVDGGLEKIYRNNPQPPFFKDLALDDRLNDAAQLQAEWAAKQNYMGHDGPGNYKGSNMTSLGQRADHFAPNYGSIVEAGGGNDTPEGWMKSETHFRPWFNILHDVGYLGFGVAIGGDGQMRAFAVPAATRPHNTNENSTSYTFQLPIGPGAAIEREKKYPSVDGRTSLKLQEDGNLAIFYDRNRSKKNENAQDEYLWGLANSEHKVEGWKVSKVQISTAGQLEVVGKDGNILWTASSTKPNFDKNGLSEDPVVLCAGAINGNNNSNPSGGTKPNNYLNAEQRLNALDKLVSANGVFMLRMNDDGNLCVYSVKNGEPVSFVWGAYQSKSYNLGNLSTGYYAKLGDDGNLCVYDKNNNFYWGSYQLKAYALGKGYRLELTDEGKIKILNSEGQIVWVNQ